MSEFSSKVLRTIYIPGRMYEQLKDIARSRKMSFHDLVEEYIVLGMIVHSIEPSGKF